MIKLHVKIKEMVVPIILLIMVMGFIGNINLQENSVNTITSSETPRMAALSIDMNVSSADASFLGEADNDNSGWSVTGAGDVNGDGYDDFLVGAIYNDGGGTEGTGQTYLILGRESRWAMDVNLSSANASFIGEAYQDYSGYSVAGAGDVNNDSYDDILIGAVYNGEGGTDEAGQTYLILGRESGWAMDVNLSSANASFIGEAYQDYSGCSVAGAGDVNGDGYDDILVGAYRNNEDGTDAGQTYLILGKESGWAMDVSLSSANASFIGEADGDLSGWSVAGAGDVNGDGYDDILIGAYYNDEGDGYNAGQTYLILGKESGWAMDINLSSANASFIGEADSDYSGYSVAGAGDVNKDGYDDILVGADRNDDGGNMAGQTYLILGRESGWAMDVNLSSANASFIGEANQDFSGCSVAGAGDVNRDGYDDILIGAYDNNEGGTDDTGQTYLILGKESGWAMDVNLSSADISFIGEVNNDYSGRSVAGAGDVNNDGYDDILVGARGNDEGGTDDTGQTYLIFGTPSPSTPPTPPPPPPPATPPPGGISGYSSLLFVTILISSTAISIYLLKKRKLS